MAAPVCHHGPDESCRIDDVRTVSTEIEALDFDGWSFEPDRSRKPASNLISRLNGENRTGRRAIILGQVLTSTMP